MQSFTPQNAVGFGQGLSNAGHYAPDQFVSVPTENRFAPLDEWVGYSMDSQNQEPMELQWVPVRNKRKRFTTGSPTTGTDPDQINFSTLTVDEKLSQMLAKLNSLERSSHENHEM